MRYHDFLKSKLKSIPPSGINKFDRMPDAMFEHQLAITKWALRRGRAAIFAGTGLGKSIMQLAWSDHVNKHTGKPVLILTPLAVTHGIKKDADKFEIGAKIVKTHNDIINGINITNYQKLDHFDMSIFGGVVLDEASILKNEKGAYRIKLIGECKDIPFRLCATATPSPNDFMELGNQSEFLGIMSYTDMLSMFFVHDGGSTQNWRLKGHAEDKFWQWMCQWSVMLRQPKDLGFDNAGYDLPSLHNIQHLVDVEYNSDIETGNLFPIEASTMQERLSARRASVEDRVKLAASITPNNKPFVWWCNLNSESQMLTQMIDGAVELSGADSEDAKERKLIDFSEGRIRTLVTKPKICSQGLNWQHCADTGFVGLNDSFEQVYQAVRRFWRFGQDNEVTVHFVASELEGAVVSNIKRKELDMIRMGDAMVKHMADLTSDELKGTQRDTMDYVPVEKMKLPAFL